MPTSAPLPGYFDKSCFPLPCPFPMMCYFISGPKQWIWPPVEWDLETVSPKSTVPPLMCSVQVFWSQWHKTKTWNVTLFYRRNNEESAQWQEEHQGSEQACLTSHLTLSPEKRLWNPGRHLRHLLLHWFDPFIGSSSPDEGLRTRWPDHGAEFREWCAHSLELLVTPP